MIETRRNGRCLDTVFGDTQWQNAEETYEFLLVNNLNYHILYIKSQNIITEHLLNTDLRQPFYIRYYKRKKGQMLRQCIFFSL